MIRTVDLGPIDSTQPTMAARLRYNARERLANHEVYLAVARRRGRAVVTNSTELMIEGFPRSASSFAVAAFQVAQSRPVRVAHHLHSSAHVIRAARTNVPTLVTIRRPDDVALSTAIYVGRIELRDAIRAYCRFYERIAAVKECFVVGGFEQVTTDFGLLIEQVNRRFGTQFERFEHTPENLNRVRQLLELSAQYRRDPSIVRPYLSGAADGPRVGLDRAVASEAVVARPSSTRQEMKSALLGQYLGDDLSSLRDRAWAAYHTVAAGE